MKKFVILLLISVAFSVSGLVMKKLSLSEQVKKSDVIALVKIVEAKELYRNKVYKKEILVEVLEGIHNITKGEKFKIIANTGMVYSEINFECLGEKAIVLLEKSSYQDADYLYFEPVNAEFSVYKLRKDRVNGFGFFSLSYDDAKEKIEKLIGSTKGSS